MAEPIKRGNRWYVEVYVRGVRRGRSFDTKREADYWKADTERRLRMGKGLASAAITLADVLDRFAREEVPHRHDKTTEDGAERARWEENRLAFLARDVLASLTLDKLTAEAIDEWQKRRLQEVEGSTIRRDRALLSAVMKKAVKVWKYLAASPFPDVALPEDGEDRWRVCTPNELKRLHAAAGADVEQIQTRVILAFEFGIETGMRGKEICALTRQHAPEGRTFVHVPKSKNGDARDVALSTRAMEILALMRARKTDPLFDLTTSQKDAHFRKMTKRAAIDGLTFHDSRHTACTLLAKRLQVLDLARQLGTRDINTLLVYYNPAAEERAKLLG